MSRRRGLHRLRPSYNNNNNNRNNNNIIINNNSVERRPKSCEKNNFNNSELVRVCVSRDGVSIKRKFMLVQCVSPVAKKKWWQPIETHTLPNGIVGEHLRGGLIETLILREEQTGSRSANCIECRALSIVAARSNGSLEASNATLCSQISANDNRSTDFQSRLVLVAIVLICPRRLRYRAPELEIPSVEI